MNENECVVVLVLGVLFCLAIIFFIYSAYDEEPICKFTLSGNFDLNKDFFSGYFNEIEVDLITAELPCNSKILKTNYIS